jgi:hypothetical protein
MKKKAAIVGVVAIAAAAGVGAWLAFRPDDEPWPPSWYVEATATHDKHLATWKQLRKRVTNPQDTDFPPSDAKLNLLRFMAVGASSDPGETRPSDARVYFSNHAFASTVIEGGSTLSAGASVYVLALRGKFGTADIRRPPPGPRRRRHMIPAFYPMVITLFDAATMDTTGSYLGRVRDLSPLGESIELDLDQEPA